MGNGEWFFRYVQGNDIQARRADTIIERISEMTYSPEGVTDQVIVKRNRDFAWLPGAVRVHYGLKLYKR